MPKGVKDSVCTFVILCLSSLAHAQNFDTLNISIYLDKKLLVDQGMIIQSKVKIASDDLELKGAYYVLKSKNEDSIHIRIKYRHYSTSVSLINALGQHEICLQKSKYIIRFDKGVLYMMYLKNVCPNYGLNFINPFGLTTFWVLENEKQICKKCKRVVTRQIP
jgi:hypothetical protein